MTTLVPYNEPPIPRVALEIERLRQRLDAAEAELKARENAPPPALPGKLLAGIAGVATLALVVIAGSLVWQQVNPAAPAQPTIVVQAAPAAGQGAVPAQGQAQGQVPQPTYQASAAPPAYRPPISLPPPARPPSRW